MALPELAVTAYWDEENGQPYKTAVWQGIPRLYHRLGDAAGVTQVADDSPGQYMGFALVQSTVNGGVTFRQSSALPGDVDDYAALFDGSTGYLSIAAGNPLSSLLTWTVEAWVYPTATRHDACGIVSMTYPGSGSIPFSIGMGNPFATFGGALPNVDSSPFVGFYTGTVWAVVSDGVALTLNEWTHLVGAWDGATLKLYRNGEQVATGVPGVAYAANANSAFNIGKRWDATGTTPFFKGRIDEPAVYPHVIDDIDIAYHYEARNFSTAAPTETDISDKVRSVTVTRGKPHFAEQDVQPGQATLTLHNRDRRFEPEYQGLIGNLIENPHYEIAESWWSEGKSAGSSIYRDPSAAVGGIGTNGIRMDIGASGTDFANVISPFIDVDTSETYLLAAIYERLSVNAEKKAYMRVACYDASSAFIAYAYPAAQPALGLSKPDGSASLNGFAAFTPPAQATRYGGLYSGAGTYVNGTVGTNAQYVNGFPPNTAKVKVQLYGASSPVAAMSVAINATQFRLSDGNIFDYVDGDQDNCRWAGAAHSSQSYYGGPYYPDVLPRKRMKFEWVYDSITYPIAAMRINQIPLSWLAPQSDGQPEHSEVTMALSDRLADLNADGGLNYTEGAQSPSAQWNALVIAAGVPDAVNNVSGISGFLWRIATHTNEDGISIASAMAESEDGRIFDSNAGELTFLGRRALQPYDAATNSEGQTVKHVFGEAAYAVAGEVYYNSVTVAMGDDEIYNVAIVSQPFDRPDQTAIDVVSRRQHGRRTLSSSTLEDDATNGRAKDHASALVARYGQPGFRITSMKVTIGETTDPATVRAVLGLEIGDRITVNRRPHGLSGGALSQTVNIEQIVVDARPGVITYAFALSPADMNIG